MNVVRPQAHVNLVDFTNATDIRPFLTDAEHDTLLQFDALASSVVRNATSPDRRNAAALIAQALADRGVQPARKVQLLNTGALTPIAVDSKDPELLKHKVEGWGETSAKQEGLTLVNGCTLALGALLNSHCEVLRRKSA